MRDTAATCSSHVRLVAFQASPDKRSHQRDKVQVRGNRVQVIKVSSGCISQIYVPNIAAINCRDVREYWRGGLDFYVFGAPFFCQQRQLLQF